MSCHPDKPEYHFGNIKIFLLLWVLKTIIFKHYFKAVSKTIEVVKFDFEKYKKERRRLYPTKQLIKTSEKEKADKEIGELNHMWVFI